MSLDEALKKIKEAKKSNAYKLDLSGLGLTEVPSELSQLTQLKELNLTGNKLTYISGLDKLIQLTILNLGHNQLDKINGIEALNQLRELYLGYNKLNKITGLERLTELVKLALHNNFITKINGLEQLKKLTFLHLHRNRIKKIEGLETLTKLMDLALSDNQLKEICGLEKLSQLKILYLHANQIKAIKGLESLTKLYYLQLTDNQITNFPEYFLKLGLPIHWKVPAETKGIIVGDNPFRNPPPEIIQQGNEAIEEYFEQREKSGGELLNEAKLILLGDGRSGKTSLANRLLNKELPKEEDRTQGVDIVIGEYSFPISNGKDFKINIWDFAGQDKYKTLHQLFYTESSLYVMVAESGKSTVDFDDWFQTAELFGEGSPLVLILNEFKEGIGMGSFDIPYWKKQFPSLLKEVFTVNLGTKQNFEKAEEFIRLLAQTLPHTKYTFPSNWAAIRRILNERRNEQYIDLEEYLKICKNNNLPEEDSALVLSSVLHKVGDCLHYQKNELLRQLIILKNEWATEAVYKILDDKEVAENKCGFFDMSDVRRIWDSKEYRTMRPQLLELMKQFRLAYQLPLKEEFVTPPLLPPARPKGFSWPEAGTLELYIEYEFLPKALLTQFIVTRHADIANGRTLVWRHGVILEWENEALAEVSKTKLRGRDAFHIRTQGKNRKGIMTVIIKTFRELHAEYKGIRYKEKVPCICKGCLAKENNQHYFDFDNLKFRIEKGRNEVECDNSLEQVDLIELLENSFVFERFKEGNSLQLKEIASPKSKIFRVFLASSNELLGEREKIELALGRKNKLLREKGIIVELLIWEDGKHIGKSLRSQNNYNLEVKECDLFTMLFYSKVGKYSSEEFELAHSLFDEANMPRMCIFQKDTDLPKNQSQADANSRFEFLNRLKELEHFPVQFKNTDELVGQLETVIDKLLLDKDFVEKLKTE